MQGCKEPLCFHCENATPEEVLRSNQYPGAPERKQLRFLVHKQLRVWRDLKLYARISFLQTRRKDRINPFLCEFTSVSIPLVSAHLWLDHSSQHVLKRRRNPSEKLEEVKYVCSAPSAATEERQDNGRIETCVGVRRSSDPSPAGRCVDAVASGNSEPNLRGECPVASEAESDPTCLLDSVFKHASFISTSEPRGPRWHMWGDKYVNSDASDFPLQYTESCGWLTPPGNSRVKALHARHLPLHVHQNVECFYLCVFKVVLMKRCVRRAGVCIT